MEPVFVDGERAGTVTMTLEAFADTIVPGEKRFPGDRAIAGVSTGGGAVAAGALDLLSHPAGGLAEALENLAVALDGHAVAYADQRGLMLDSVVPPFVSLPYKHRVDLILILCAAGHPERQLWVNLATFSNMAFDSGAHLNTVDALAAGHPGLLTIGFAKPNKDGFWRFPDFSYRRPLAKPHPNTTPSGSPE
jgi:enediyne biosynthesis protein E8